MEMHMKMYFTVKVWKSPYKNIEVAEAFMHSHAQRYSAVAIGCMCKDGRLARSHCISSVTVFTTSDQEAKQEKSRVVSSELRAQHFLSLCWVGSQLTPTPRLMLWCLLTAFLPALIMCLVTHRSELSFFKTSVWSHWRITRMSAWSELNALAHTWRNYVLVLSFL